MIRLGHAHIFERCGGSSDAMLWPSKNAPILVYLIILSHGRSRLWRATSTLVIQGIMIRSWFCSRPRRRLSRTTRRTDYGHPPKFRGFSRLLIRQFHQSLFRYGIHTLAKWSLGRTEEVSYICFTDSSRGLAQKNCEKFAKYSRNICEIFAKYSRKIRKNFAKKSQKICEKKICAKFVKNSGIFANFAQILIFRKFFAIFFRNFYEFFVNILRIFRKYFAKISQIFREFFAPDHVKSP